jgi:hypothetical protein
VGDEAFRLTQRRTEDFQHPIVFFLCLTRDVGGYEYGHGGTS